MMRVLQSFQTDMYSICLTDMAITQQKRHGKQENSTKTISIAPKERSHGNGNDCSTTNQCTGRLVFETAMYIVRPLGIQTTQLTTKYFTWYGYA